MAENVSETKRFSKRGRPAPEPNPCAKEQEMSYECLSKNNYEQRRCALYFENYKTCKAFWNELRIERMRNGIEPLIPDEEERRKIMEERFKGKKTL